MLHAWRMLCVAVVAWGAMATIALGGPVALPPDCATRTHEDSAVHIESALSAAPSESPVSADAPFAADPAAAANADPTNGAPALIPLPPAVWSGMAGLATLAGAAAVRRFR